MIRAVRGFVVMTLGMASALPSQTTPAAPQLPSVSLPPELDRVLRDYERAWSARDAAALARLFADDGFVLQPRRPPVRGRAAIEDAYRGSGGPLALRALAYATADTVGYIVGAYASRPADPDIGKFILLLTRTGNGPWMIAADMDNPSSPPGAGAGAALPARLDHIILFTGSLSRGIAEFARLTGVTPVVGGEHPGRGTRNALVSLGGGAYLEILAPVTDSGPALPLTPYGWAVGTDDLEALAARLRTLGMSPSDPMAGSRRRPDGELLSWRTLAISSAPGAVPFFIEWGKDTRHPSTSSPAGCTLETFAITEPDPAMLRALVETLRLPVTVRVGAERRTSLSLRCPNGPVTFER